MTEKDLMEDAFDPKTGAFDWCLYEQLSIPENAFDSDVKYCWAIIDKFSEITSPDVFETSAEAWDDFIYEIKDRIEDDYYTHISFDDEVYVLKISSKTEMELWE